MDRQIVYPGEVLTDTALLTQFRSIMEALGYVLQGAFGTTGAVVGLACTPTSPASMTVNVSPGAITANTVVDTLSYGSLGTDTTDPLVKMGINVSNTQFTLTPPSSGTNQYYLISAAFSEQNAGSAVDAYYNPANPSQPYSGPANSGAAQFNTITQTVNLVLTAGTPTSGTPTLPATPAGAVALYSIYVAGGATSIVAGNITALPSAPFAPFQAPLQYLTPGTKNLAVYIPTNQGNWTVPNGISKIRVRMWGGGGAGGPGSGGAGGGGGAGGYTEGYLTVTPGNQYFVTVGGGGVGAGTPGGGSSFASLMTVLGGSGGGAGSSGTNTIGSGGAGAAVGTGGNILIAGNAGGDGVCFSTSGIGMGGTGGGAHSGDGAAGIIGIVTSPRDGHSVATVGGGGGGAIGSGLGGQGGPGLVLIEW